MLLATASINAISTPALTFNSKYDTQSLKETWIQNSSPVCTIWFMFLKVKLINIYITYDFLGSVIYFQTIFFKIHTKFGRKKILAKLFLRYD